MRPATGESFAWIMPHVSTAAMNLFLRRFAKSRPKDEHAVMVLDGAGWHTARTPRVPRNVTLVPLPRYSPQLNPIERVWLYLRERHLSHRLLPDYDAILDALRIAWNRLTPERLHSLTPYPYLEGIRT